MKLYAEISKTEEMDDGTIKVWGYASSEAVDSDGETITAEAMKAALPDYLKFGAVREMHQAKAAGTAIEAEVQDDGRTFFGAHVVDSEAVKKVKTKVYKGFSIGGKVTGRDEVNKTTITGLKLVEVSLVDRPANPEAVFTMYKADGLDGENAVDELAKLLDAGAITPERLVELAKADSVAKVVNNEAASTEGTKAAADDSEKSDAVSGVTDKAGAATTSETDLKKGMWNVADFASVLQSLAYVCSEAQWEMEWEADSSPVPAQLRTWIADGVKIFTAMAVEEANELVACLVEQAGPEVEVMMLAHQAGALRKRLSDPALSASAYIDIAKAYMPENEVGTALFKSESTPEENRKALTDVIVAKAGARNSKADASKIQDMHDTSVELGAMCGESEKHDHSGDLAKTYNHEFTFENNLGKVSGITADHAMVINSSVKKISDERDTLKKRVKELEAMPAPSTAVLKSVPKSADVVEINEVEVDPVLKQDGSVDEVATEFRKVFASGGKPLTQR